MRSLIYAAAFGALLTATSANAAITFTFSGATDAGLQMQNGQSMDLPTGGVVASLVKNPNAYYGGSTTADVEIQQNNSASFTSGVAARGTTPNMVTATSTTGVNATITNLGNNGVSIGSVNSTIIQAGMGFMVQNPTGTAINNDVFTGYGASQTGSFGDFNVGGVNNGKTIATASFAFNIYGSNYLLDDNQPNPNALPLYTLSGQVTLGFDANGNVIETTNQSLATAQSVLNDFQQIYPSTLPLNNSDKVAGYQWDETPVAVPLDTFLEGDGGSTTLYYRATSTVSIDQTCISSSECLVAYSGFGDPVGRGGGTDAIDDFADFGFFDGAGTLGTFDQPNTGTDPNTISQIIFSPQTIDPFSLGVPEPATWVSMIMGFGLMGAALRRRRVLSYS